MACGLRHDACVACVGHVEPLWCLCVRPARPATLVSGGLCASSQHRRQGAPEADFDDIPLFSPPTLGAEEKFGEAYLGPEKSAQGEALGDVPLCWPPKTKHQHTANTTKQQHNATHTTIHHSQAHKQQANNETRHDTTNSRQQTPNKHKQHQHTTRSKQQTLDNQQKQQQQQQ